MQKVLKSPKIHQSSTRVTKADTIVSMDALKSLLDNEKGLVAMMMMVGATIFVMTGKMAIEEWKSLAGWIFTAYAGATAIHQSAVALGGKSTPSAPPTAGDGK